ncbi:hypothetical protein Tco_0717234 [Tanacetum coccineum]
MSFDDLYNNFKIVKQEVKGTTSSSSSSQYMAFVSSPSSNNEVNTAYGVSTANTQVSPASTQVSIASTQVSTANLSDDTDYAFLASQPNGSQLVYEDLEQIHEDNIEEMDLKWQLALLSMRTRRFFQKTGRKITINGSDIAGYDKSNPSGVSQLINNVIHKKKSRLLFDSGCSWHMKEHVYLLDFRNFDGEYVTSTLWGEPKEGKLLVKELLKLATAKAKTINGEVQIQALVDGKKVIITKTSVRRDFQLKDVECTECLPNATIFTELERMGFVQVCWYKQVEGMPNIRNYGTTFLTLNMRGEGKEDRLKLNELLELYTKLSKRVLDLENTKTSQAAEITKLKERVKKLERRNKSRTPGLKRLRKVGRYAQVVSFDDECLGAQEDASKQGRKIANIDADEEEVEVEKVVSTAEVTTVSATLTTVDELTLAQTLIEVKAAKPRQLMDKRKKHFAKLRAEEIRRKPPTKAQKRNQIYKGCKSQTKGSKKRTREELESDNSKKQKIDENVEAEVDDEAEMKKLMEIVPDDELMEVQGGTHQMIRMLQNIDREDLETLWKLVKAKHGNTRPEEAYEKILEVFECILHDDCEYFLMKKVEIQKKNNKFREVVRIFLKALDAVWK